ncbi:hypothetical protein PAXRUDRAFT_165131, partial [Paxillus rubicundulus Ve08.2h10]
SPLIRTPTQLFRFLQHAEAQLGISNATRYEGALHMQDIGPDILPDVSDWTLQDMGMSTGDIIWLKKGSAPWWKGPDSKRKCSDSETLTESCGLNLTLDRSSAKKIAYERCYHDGGASRFSAGAMWADKDDSRGLHNYDIFYHSDIHAQWLPVPKGFSIDEEEDS